MQFLLAAVATHYKQKTIATVYIALISRNIVVKVYNLSIQVAKMIGTSCASIAMMEWDEF